METKIHNLKIALGTLLGAYREVSKQWTELDSNIEESSYPYALSFDEHVSEVGIWVEDFCANLNDIEHEKENIPITYATIKRTVGWSRFAEITNRNVYAIKEHADFQDREMFYISEGQAEILGL
jgi:hypothetical protein